MRRARPSSRPEIAWRLRGPDLAYIEWFAVPEGQRRRGVGHTTYTNWERQLPESVKLIRLHASDPGTGSSVPFWGALGFNFRWSEDEIAEAQEEGVDVSDMEQEMEKRRTLHAKAGSAGRVAESAQRPNREIIKALFVRLTREVGPRCQKDDGWIGCEDVAQAVAGALREHGIDARYVEGDASYGGHGEPTEHGFHVWIVVENMVLDPKSLLLRDAGASHWRYWNYEESFLDEPPKRTRFATVPLDDAYVPDPLDDLEVLVRALGDTELFGRVGSEFAWKLADNGFHVLGIGGSRIVVALDADRVAKIDAQPDGPNNANELDVWSDYGETGLLAPIIDERADGRILVMRRAAPFEGPADASGRVASVPRRLRKKLDAAKEELSELLGPDFVDPSYDFNWGLLDGRLVCIDYAS